MEDPNGQFSLDEILSPAHNDRFKPYPQEVIALGITKSVYWFRLRLPPDRLLPQQLLQFNNPNIDRLDVFFPVESNTTSSPIYYLPKSGGVRTLSDREIWDNTWVFALPSQYRVDAPIYFRLESTSALRLPILLWKNNDFISNAFLRNLGFGLFYGILLALMLFQCFVYFVLRDKSYLFYVIYISSMLFYQFQVHGHFKLWSNLPYPVYNSIFWFGLTSAFIASILFTWSFLQVHSEDAPWNKILPALVILALLQGSLGILGYNIAANQLAHALGLGGPIVIMTLAVSRLRQGFHPAKYFLLSWGTLTVGIIIWVLAAYLPDTISSVNFLLIATAAEAILLSFALADRVKTLRLREMALTKHMAYYRDLSSNDELTGLYNRRHLKKELQKTLAAAKQAGTPLCLLVMDVDHFKMYNDRHGHWEGDQVLMRLGKLLRNVLDVTQPAFRYGGEEFVVLLPNTTCDIALPISENLRQLIQKEVFTPPLDGTATVTVSIGIGELHPGDSSDKLFQRADEALYKAKSSGRNRVVCAGINQTISTAPLS